MSFEYFWVESCAVDLYEAWALNRAASVQNNNWLYAVFSIECARLYVNVPPSTLPSRGTSLYAAKNFHEVSARTRDRLRCIIGPSQLLESFVVLQTSGADPSPRA
jgi:hypothetical protein